MLRRANTFTAHFRGLGVRRGLYSHVFVFVYLYRQPIAAELYWQISAVVLAVAKNFVLQLRGCCDALLYVGVGLICMLGATYAMSVVVYDRTSSCHSHNEQ